MKVGGIHMKNVITNNLITLTEQLFTELYTHKNPNMIIQHLSKDIESYGLLFENKTCSYHDICHYFTHLCRSTHSFDMQNSHFQIITQTNDICVIDGIYELVKNKNQQSLKHYHLTIVYLLENNHAFIKHIHVSSPYQIKTNDKVKYSQFDMKSIFNQSSMAGLYCAYLDEKHTFYLINDTLALMLGYCNQGELLKVYNNVIDMIYHEDRVQIQNNIQQYLTYGNIYNVEYRMMKKDGSLIWVMEQGQRFYDEYDNEFIHAFISDISELKKNELDLMVQKQKYSLALKDNSITILEYDIQRDRLIIDIQIESKKKIYDHYLEYVSSDRSTVFKEDRHLVCDLFLRKIEGPIEIREHIRGTNRFVRKSIDSTIIYDAKNQPVIVLATARDITTEWNFRTLLEQKIQKDSLTQLLNLESGKEKIENYLRTKPLNTSCCLFMIDIDYFKTINDNYGHYFGNEVLITFSQCLSSIVNNDDLVIRTGGDEFMILFKNIDKCSSTKKAEEICHSIRNLRFNEKISITSSIGACFLDAYQVCSFEQLFKGADYELYRAKENGRNGFSIASYLELSNNRDHAQINDEYHTLLKLLNNQENIDYTTVYQKIAKKYKINRISLIKVNKETLHYTHDNLYISSRSYQSSMKEGYLNQRDYLLFKDNHYMIIQCDEDSLLSSSLKKLLMQGVAKTIFITWMQSQQYITFLSYVHYEQSKDWTNDECQELVGLSSTILTYMNQ